MADYLFNEPNFAGSGNAVYSLIIKKKWKIKELEPLSVYCNSSFKINSDIETDLDQNCWHQGDNTL